MGNCFEMNTINVNECTKCHNQVKQTEHEKWECPYCGSIFTIETDADGNKSILRTDAPVSGEIVAAPESTDLDYSDNLNLIAMYIQKEKWDDARDIIGKLKSLGDPCATAAAIWYDMACKRKAHNDSELVASFSNITDADTNELYNLLLSAAPDFKKRILDLILEQGYVGDRATTGIFTTILPFMFSEVIYTPEQYRQKVEFAFDRVIELEYHQAFKFLLEHTLEPNEKDRYVAYLERFAQKLTSEKSLRYYSMIIESDENNTDAHHNLVEADIDAGCNSDKYISDFENLIAHSASPQDDVKKFISILLEESYVTEHEAEFMRVLIDKCEDEDAKTEATARYADKLLGSEVWDKAQDFYNALLQTDPNNAGIFFKLCLADMKAQTVDELLVKKEPFTENQYYRKALAIAYKTDEDYAGYLESLIDKRDGKLSEQKIIKTNKIKNITKIAGAILFMITLIGGIIGFNIYNNHKKYAESNIVLSVTDKSYSENGYSLPCNFDLKINLKNNSTLATEEIYGVMYIYNSADEVLYEGDVHFQSYITSGNDNNFDLNIKQDAAKLSTELHNASLSDLKITWKLTEVTYKNNVTKKYDTNEKVIHKPGQTEKGSTSQEKYDSATATQIQSALDIIDAGTINDRIDDYDMDVAEALATIKDTLEDYTDGENFSYHFEMVFNAAKAYETAKHYEKACWLYDILGMYEYPDAAILAQNCANSWYLNNALKVISEADENSPTLSSQISSAVYTISQLCYDSAEPEQIKQTVYDKATELKQNAQYRKAYYLFDTLAGYKDVAELSESCKLIIESQTQPQAQQ